jgi:hypothetical protein
MQRLATPQPADVGGDVVGMANKGVMGDARGVRVISTLGNFSNGSKLGAA